MKQSSMVGRVEVHVKGVLAARPGKGTGVREVGRPRALRGRWSAVVRVIWVPSIVSLAGARLKYLFVRSARQ